MYSRALYKNLQWWGAQCGRKAVCPTGRVMTVQDDWVDKNNILLFLLLYLLFSRGIKE